METKYIWHYILQDEYVCHHCKQFPPSYQKWSVLDFESPFIRLFKAFEQLRESWGKAIHIESGYRCSKHNMEIKGAVLSTHLFGLALDLNFTTSEETKEFLNLANEKTGYLRIGTYKNNLRLIHIDVGYLIYPKAILDWVRGMRWES